MRKSKTIIAIFQVKEIIQVLECLCVLILKPYVLHIYYYCF